MPCNYIQHLDEAQLGSCNSTIATSTSTTTSALMPQGLANIYYYRMTSRFKQQLITLLSIFIIVKLLYNCFKQWKKLLWSNNMSSYQQSKPQAV